MANALTIKVKGLEKAIRDLNKFSTKGLQTALLAALNKSADLTLRTLRGNTPVDTGNLKSSEEKVIDRRDLKAAVGPNLNIAPYAPFVELGHHTRSGSFVAGQFFIQKTALEVAGPVIEIFRQAINIQLLKDFGR